MNKQSRYHQSSAQLNEEQKMIASAKENPKLFEPLYVKYHESIFRFIYQRMDDKDLAFDVTNNVFIKALSNIQKYQFKGVPFSAWLFRIAQNELYKTFKDKKTQRTVNVETDQLNQIADEIEEQDHSDYIHNLLLEHLNTLPETDLQLIELRFFESRSFKEIGDILDLTENNAKVKCFRALQKLKKQLNIIRN